MNPLVIIPTYNESQSITEVIDGLLSLRENVEILVVDDNSPDGTAQLVVARGIPRIHLLSRESKTGLGGAYRAGFFWALSKKRFSHVVTMDGDGSHRAIDLSLMLSRRKRLILSFSVLDGCLVVRSSIGPKVGNCFPKLALDMPNSL